MSSGGTTDSEHANALALVMELDGHGTTEWSYEVLNNLFKLKNDKSTSTSSCPSDLCLMFKSPVSSVPVATPPRCPRMENKTKDKTVVLRAEEGQRSEHEIIVVSRQIREQSEEIFRIGNLLTPLEKNYILQYMSGNNDNPCPDVGRLASIIMSKENKWHKQNDGSIRAVCAEIHFYMNYGNGDWVVFKKSRQFCY